MHNFTAFIRAGRGFRGSVTRVLDIQTSCIDKLHLTGHGVMNDIIIIN
jgi:hypothetical protein